MEVTPACYAHFTSALMGLAHGRVAVVLEGGYCLKSLAEGAALTLRTLLGDPCPVIDKFGTPCQRSGVSSPIKFIQSSLKVKLNSLIAVSRKPSSASCTS